ncbi:bifunctional phosphoribosyl-AMP cyclohydrolase/phosphoribosyl-ATP diphosphatase HisIE [Petrocella sp. FN5]|nr:bifunctional phosphoribosyl-AMP cyclohydrolase/phosphoribosyl-ATP diphosphatase HisIE [Petrocella sp. FN5]MDF1616341.1 bifunctional phosphoribosyl-AMP cyclohydrolase/phosphoribosyl-ATP diphosphatase HisIE [Petrocella sp. FN5]
MNFNDFKLGEDGLLPVIVQDYMTSQVLMMAYMNEEAYTKTIETGKATFYSRSRKSLWIKGETSGHYQRVKEIALDCDQDTLLLKVHQEGNACHTGAYSCFYRYFDENEGDYLEVDTFKQKDVLSGVFDVVMDRKVNPKEGSYTNYLFEKGIDKILKKVGEETAEIIIGAKNEGKEEMVYEISDLLYHLTVLMVEKGANWEDIYKELDKRR